MANQQKTDTSSPTLQTLLTRGVDTVYPSKAALEKRLQTGKPLTLYLGIDPSGADLHIGHAIPLQKLRQFQRAGHKVILLVGDFTGQTGDPTDKQAVRVPLTAQQVKSNAQKYQAQASAILDFEGANPAEIRYNSHWLAKLSFAEVAELAGHFTVQQMLERDMFENRLKDGKPISLREFLYPLMQGFDSVAMEVDLEIGATDQTFNMLAGRKLSKEYLDKEKFVLSMSLLADANGVKIGKTAGNAINLLGQPQELYGQVMSLPDEVIVNALEWCTSVPGAEVKEVATLAKTNPRDAKMRLAKAIVSEFQGGKSAVTGEEHFKSVVQRKELPAKILEKKPNSWREQNVRNFLKDVGLVASTSEAQRKIGEKSVRHNNEVHDIVNEIRPVEGDIWHIGRKYVRIVR